MFIKIEISDRFNLIVTSLLIVSKLVYQKLPFKYFDHFQITSLLLLKGD